MRYSRHKLLDIDAVVYKKLASLNMRERGLMLRTLQKLRRENSEQALVYFAESKGKILGWTLVFYSAQTTHNMHEGWNAFTYIRVGARRQGIGRELVRRVEADQSCVWHPWDKQSASFYIEQRESLGDLQCFACPYYYV